MIVFWYSIEKNEFFIIFWEDVCVEMISNDYVFV